MMYYNCAKFRFRSVLSLGVSIGGQNDPPQALTFQKTPYAGINLTGYHPPPGHPGTFAPKCVPSPGAFAQQKMPGGRKGDVPGAGHLYQLAFKHEHC